MDEKIMQFRVGAMFLGALLVTAILLLMFGKLPRLIGTYPVQVRFDYAGGVSSGTPVRKSGVLIGKVGRVQLTDNDEKVLITLEIQSDKSIYRNEDCYITRDLLGDTALTFIPDPKKPGAGERVQSDVQLEGKFSDDPTGLKRALSEPINTVTDTGRALTAASLKLEKAAESVNKILDADTQRDVKDILHDAASSLSTLRKMLGNEENQAKLSEAVQQLPDTLRSMNRTFQATDKTLQEFTQRSPTDGKTPIERMVGTIELTERTLRKFSESAEPGKPAPADQIAYAMENIGEITNLMRTIMSRIEQGDGSLGALLNDRQLYDRLNRAARNVEQVSRDLKPIVDDARVISDKVSRHPGVILRDAIKPGIGIK
jgi:phospholipid/cholesterol/gamma-HCH transport system substrate-binding protein